MKINKLNDKKLEIWLSLAKTLGPIKFFNMLNTCKSLDKMLEYLTSNKIQEAQKEINNAREIRAKIIPACNPDYPKTLRNIPGYPPVIAALGDVSLLSREIIAIVGGRNSSVSERILLTSWHLT